MNILSNASCSTIDSQVDVAVRSLAVDLKWREETLARAFSRWEHEGAAQEREGVNERPRSS